jgi:hypothetical protein
MLSNYGWIIGIALVVVGSIGNNLGNNLVSLGHSMAMKNEEEEQQIKDNASASSTEGLESADEASSDIQAGSPTGGVHRSYRMIGTVIFVVGSLFTFASFAFGAQSLIASLESVQFVSNVIFAKYVHKEKITMRMLIATLSIVAGNIMVVIFSNHEAQHYTSDKLIRLYVTNTAYQVYLCLAFLLWAFTAWLYSSYFHSRMVLRQLRWNHSFIEPLAYAISSTIIGTQAVLNSKSLALLIGATTAGTKNEFGFWYMYLMLSTWLVLVVFWLRRLDLGLSLFPPLFIIPVMQVFFVFFAILCGGIYFQEFITFSVTQYIGFCLGVVLILMGVYGLAPVDMVLYVPKDPTEASCNRRIGGNNNEDESVDAHMEDECNSKLELDIDDDLVVLEIKVKQEQPVARPDGSAVVIVEELDGTI